MYIVLIVTMVATNKLLCHTAYKMCGDLKLFMIIAIALLSELLFWVRESQSPCGYLSLNLSRTNTKNKYRLKRKVKK